MKCDDCLFCSGIKWIGGYPQVKCEQPYMRGKHPDADVGCEWRVQKKRDNDDKDNQQRNLFEK